MFQTEKSDFRKLLCLLIFFILLFGIAIFVFLQMGKKEKNPNLLKFSAQSDSISLHNMLPLSDEIGKKIESDGDNSSYYDFSIQSLSTHSMDYEIYLVREGNKNRLEPEYIKLYLTDKNNIPLKGFEGKKIPTFHDLRVASTDIDGRLVYSGTISPKKTLQFRLRIWLSDTYIITSDEKIFQSKLKVKVK